MTADNFDRILDAIQRCAAPIWASDSIAAPPTTVHDSGTCGFIYTGERHLLLTAHHVLNAFRLKRMERPEAVLAVNLGTGCTVALSAPVVVDEDADLDIAVLEFPQLAVHAGRHDKQYFPIRIWPIAAAVPGNLVAWIGFPGVRRQVAEQWGSYEPVGFGMAVSSASDHNIVLAGTVQVVNRDRSIGAAIRLGGFSGSPVFLVHPGGPQIIGVFRAGPNDQEGAANPIVLLTPTRYLRPDGTLDRAAMPPIPPRRREDK